MKRVYITLLIVVIVCLSLESANAQSGSSVGIRLTTSGQTLDPRISQGAVAGDFNNDGHLDVFLVSQDMWQGRGCGLYFGDGDGSLDLFVTIGIVGATSSNRIWLNNGQGQFHDSSLRLGTVYTTGVALGDFNEDGKLDVFISHIDYPSAFTARGMASEVWLNTTPTADLNGPIENRTTGERFSVIQYAIDLAGEGDEPKVIDSIIDQVISNHCP